MKKLVFLLLMLSAMLVSCRENDAKEWQLFYNYTLEDIMGTYSYSNVSDAFDGLTENDYCHICEDAEVSVLSHLGSASAIDFNVISQRAVFNRSFTGQPITDDDSFLVKMTLPSTSLYPHHELTAYVYKNDKGDVRLHGFARRIFYETVYENGQAITKIKYTIAYYFDVIKN